MAGADIDLPLKITLTTAGVDWLEKNHKVPKRLQMADRRLAYGFAVSAVPTSTLQRMINIDYIASVELARPEFSSKSGQIIDLTKLIVHRILLKKFENDTSRMLVESALVNTWNQQNPAWAIGKGVSSAWMHMDSVFDRAAAEMQAASLDILAPLIRKYVSDTVLSEDERSLRARLSNSFALRASKPLWWVLAKSRGQAEYAGLRTGLRSMLESYTEKAVISKHLALIVVELLGLTEENHFDRVASRLRGKGSGPFVEEVTREDVRLNMETRRDLLSLTYHLDRGEESPEKDRRLRVTIQEQGGHTVKERIEELVGIQPRGKPAARTRVAASRPHPRAERGRANVLSTLRTECEKQKVGVDISVTQVPRGNLSQINLAFQL